MTPLYCILESEGHCVWAVPACAVINDQSPLVYILTLLLELRNTYNWLLVTVLQALSVTVLQALNALGSEHRLAVRGSTFAYPGDWHLRPIMKLFELSDADLPDGIRICKRTGPT